MEYLLPQRNSLTIKMSDMGHINTSYIVHWRILLYKICWRHTCWIISFSWHARRTVRKNIDYAGSKIYTNADLVLWTWNIVCILIDFAACIIHIFLTINSTCSLQNENWMLNTSKHVLACHESEAKVSDRTWWFLFTSQLSNMRFVRCSLKEIYVLVHTVCCNWWSVNILHWSISSIQYNSN